MSKSETIRSVVSAFLGVDVGQLGPDYPLGDRLRNSIVRAGLQARLHRELGNMPPPLVDIATYGQLEHRLLFGQSAAPAVPSPASTPARSPDRAVQPQPSSGSDLSCGVDIEAVESLPEAADYWSHPFYADTFSHAEIAECILGPSPREHFAARWCAKEALIKCDPAFRDVRLADIEVRKDEAGVPRLVDLSGERPRPLAVAVSLTHAGGFAAALVVAGQPTPAASSRPSAAASPGSAGSPRTPLISWIALGAALIALVTAIAAWVG